MDDHEFASRELLTDSFIANSQKPATVWPLRLESGADYAENLISQKVFKGRR